MEGPDIQKFYHGVIRSLEKLYQENQSDNAIWEAFKKQLSNKFRLEITFDSKFSEAFREYFRDVNEKFRSSETYLPLLNWIEKLNTLAYLNRFSSYRDFIKIEEQVKDIKRSPSNAWLSQLSYVRSNELQEFRAEFLIRFCRLSEVEVESQAEEFDSREGQKFLKEQYDIFFKRFFEEGVDLRVAAFVESEWSSHENKGEMLSRQLIVRLQKLLGGEVGRNKGEVEVNRMLGEVAQSNLWQNDRDIQQRLESEVQLIEKTLQKFSGLNVIKQKNLTLRLAKFGSLTSGFAGLDADLDLTILTNCYVNEVEFLNLLYDFLKKQYQEGDKRSRGRRVTPEKITSAKTPLVTIKIAETGKSEIKIDLIVNNILGVINSRFLSIYAEVRWVKNLGILVKLWGKAVRLIDKSYFSSYAMILMLIHYLIKIKAVRPLLDARTRLKDSPHFRFKRLKQNQVQQFDVYYCFLQRSQDVASSDRANYLALLTGFMKYYAVDLWKENEEQRVITVDQSRDRNLDREYAITIKDPFDQPHNPGRLRIEHKDFMVQRFKEAHEILSLSNPERVRELFEPL